jgi:hypothetical protein
LLEVSFRPIIRLAVSLGFYLLLFGSDSRSCRSGEVYTSLLPLPASFEPTDNLETLLCGLADRLGTLRKGGERDLDAARGYLIRAFREGKLGRWTLDDLETPTLDMAGSENALDTFESTEDVGILRESLCLDSNLEQKTANRGDFLATSQPLSLLEPPLRQRPSTRNLDLDQRVSLAVRSFLATTAAHASNSMDRNDLSFTQQRKAQARRLAQERVEKLRAKGVDVDGERKWDWRAKTTRGGRPHRRR